MKRTYKQTVKLKTYEKTINIIQQKSNKRKTQIKHIKNMKQNENNIRHKQKAIKLIKKQHNMYITNNEINKKYVKIQTTHNRN